MKASTIASGHLKETSMHAKRQDYFTNPELHTPLLPLLWQFLAQESLPLAQLNRYWRLTFWKIVMPFASVFLSLEHLASFPNLCTRNVRTLNYPNTRRNQMDPL
jgi:hypothetical protein